MNHVSAALALAVLAVGDVACAATVWLELTDGELSADGAAPTRLAVSPGENSWSGRVGQVPGIGSDTDLVTFNVPSGLWLTSLRFDRYDESPDIGGGSFLAIAAGASVDTGFGSVHLSNALVNSTGEWLDDLAAGPRFGPPSANVTGFTAPLPAGDYVVWLGELSTLIDYTLTATLAVPEPAGTATLAAFLSSAICVRRKNPR
jgi:hypothetical protein